MAEEGSASWASRLGSTLHLTIGDHRLSLSVGEGLFTEQGWRLLFEVRMPLLQRVELSNGKDLARMAGELALSSGGTEKDGKTIGVLNFLPAFDGRDAPFPPRPESYSIRIMLPERRLWELVGLIQRGTKPTAASINVHGLKPSARPDTDKWEFQVGEQPASLPIDGVAFSFAREVDART